MTDGDADKNLPDVDRAEEKKDETDDPLHTGQDNLLMLESEDIEAKQDGVWKKLWDSMNPSACLAPATACTNVLLDDETVEYNTIVPPMLRDIDHPGKQRTLGLQRLYRFTDRERQKNRVPAVASTRFNTMDVLIPCLATDVAAYDRRQALLILNNLCIPSENKRTILLGPSRDKLLSALLKILQQKLSECHLAVACLFNLSFYEETKGMLLHYVPAVNLKRSENDIPEQYSFSQPTEKEDSLLRTLEGIVRAFLPHFLAHRKALKQDDSKKKRTAAPSVEELTLRWTMCLLRNLASVEDHAVLLATTTTLPAAALQILEVVADDTDLSLWSHDSLPEACLVFWVWLVEVPDKVRRYLVQKHGEAAEPSAVRILTPITAQPGIQGIRARRVSTKLRPVDGEEYEDSASGIASF